MATVAGLYGLGEENRKYRLKQAANEREKDREREKEHKHSDKTPDGFSEP